MSKIQILLCAFLTLITSSAWAEGASPFDWTQAQVLFAQGTPPKHGNLDGNWQRIGSVQRPSFGYFVVNTDYDPRGSLNDDGTILEFNFHDQNGNSVVDLANVGSVTAEQGPRPVNYSYNVDYNLVAANFSQIGYQGAQEANGPNDPYFSISCRNIQASGPKQLICSIAYEYPATTATSPAQDPTPGEIIGYYLFTPEANPWPKAPLFKSIARGDCGDSLAEAYENAEWECERSGYAHCTFVQTVTTSDDHKNNCDLYTIIKGSD